MTAPTSMRGYVSDEAYYTILGDALEHVPDLTWPLSVQTYAQMRHEPQLTAIRGGYTLPILSGAWALDGTGCRPEVTALVADDLGLPVVGDDTPGAARTKGVSWREHLRAGLQSLAYGHMGFEMLADTDSGQARLIALSERLPNTITRIHADPKTGAFLGVTQDDARSFALDAEPQIPAKDMVWYCHEREGAAWYGTSLMRPAYGPWLLKREMLRVLGTSSRRFAMGVPNITWAPGSMPTPAQHREALAAASAARVGDSAGLALPPGAQLALTGLTGSVPDTLGFVNFLNREMSRAALAGWLDLGETATGARALADSMIDFFLLAVRAIGDDLAEVATRQAAARIVGWNWNDEPVPRVVVTDIGNDQEVTAEALQLLLTSGALSSDPALERYLRRKWKLPEKEVPQPRLRRTPGTPTTTPAPAPGEPTTPPAPSSTQPAVPPAPTTPAARRRARPAARRRSNGQRALPLAAAGDIPGLRRQPTDDEIRAAVDFAAVQKVWAEARDQFTDAWAELIQPVVDWIVEQIRALLGDGNPAGAAALVVPATTLASVVDGLTDAMAELAGESAEQAVAEAAAQGVDVDAAVPDRDTIQAHATGVANLVASGYVNGAARTVLNQTGPGTNPDQAADAVRAHLDALSEADDRGWVVTNVASALTWAQGAARLAVFEGVPEDTDAVWISSEILDTSACSACINIDGTRFDTLDEAIDAYPTGNRYRECFGGERCRGQLIMLVD